MSSRRPPEDWREQLAAMGLVGEQILSHYPEAAERLQVFDQARRCPKCGGKATARWFPDRLKRDCKRCGFAWHELPLSSPLAPETEEPPAQPEG